MRIRFALLFPLTLPLFAAAQMNQYCIANRFAQTPLFDSSEIRKDSNIVFANTKNIFSNQMQALQLDVYYPDTTLDPLSQRPFILLIHGGAFLAGTRQEMAYECMEFARRGFVTATMDYRLGWNCPATDLIGVCIYCQGQNPNLVKSTYCAAQDARAALRYIHTNATNWQIDPNTIFIGGESAGSITAMHATFWDQSEANAFCPSCVASAGTLDTAGNNLPTAYTINGIVDHCGAVNKDSIVLDNSNIPVVSFHDDGDCTVPDGYGQVISCLCQPFWYAAGSQIIYNKITGAGGCAEINTVPNSINHCSYPQSVLVKRASCFLKHVMCGDCASAQITGVNSNVDCDSLPLQVQVVDLSGSISLFPNPAHNAVTVQYTSTSTNETSIQLYDVFGRTLRSIRPQQRNGKVEIDLNDLAPGIYQVVLINAGKYLYVQKLIVE